MAAHAAARRRLTPVAMLVAGVAAILALTGGVALAYWGTTGSGTGTATTGTMTVDVTALTSGDTNNTTLVPGGTGDVILRVNNPSTSSVHVTSITSNGSATASNNCTPTGVTFVAPTDYSAAQFTLAPGTNLVRLNGGAAMSSASASACQGATFSIPVSVTVQR